MRHACWPAGNRTTGTQRTENKGMSFSVTNTIYQRLSEIDATHTPAVVMTVVAADGHTPSRVGAKMVFDALDRPCGTIGGGSLEHAAIEHARRLLAGEGEGGLLIYSLTRDGACGEGWVETGMVCGGSVSIFFEVLNLEAPLYIFGGGHVGQALARTLQGSSFFLTIADCREEMRAYLDNRIRFVSGDYQAVLADELSGGKRAGAYVVIATHSHEWDYSILLRSLKEDWRPAYLSLMSSRKKKAWLMDRLRSDLGILPDLSHLYTPAGVAIGGRLPQEIAISIAAEMIGLYHGKADLPHLREERPQR